jgi:hypothetical protein
LRTTIFSKKTACSGCGAFLDAAIHTVGDCVPGPGDLSVCFRCGAINLFAEDMSYLPCPPEIIEEMSETDRDFIQKAVESVKKRQPN